MNFWATWCEPCKIEMPSLVDMQKKYGPQGLQIVGVAMDDADDKEISTFTHKMGVNYMVLRGTEKIGDLYGGIDHLPMTYYLDRSGKIVDETEGMAGEATFEDAIKARIGAGQLSRERNETSSTNFVCCVCGPVGQRACCCAGNFIAGSKALPNRACLLTLLPPTTLLSHPDTPRRSSSHFMSRPVPHQLQQAAH